MIENEVTLLDLILMLTLMLYGFGMGMWFERRRPK